MKDAAKYVLTLLAFILLSYALTWVAMHSFWYSALWFHSVAVVRASEAVGNVILIPVRVLYWLMGDLVDQSTPLSDPRAYTIINAGLLGILSYSCCRRILFERLPRQDP